MIPFGLVGGAPRSATHQQAKDRNHTWRIQKEESRKLCLEVLGFLDLSLDPPWKRWTKGRNEHQRINLPSLIRWFVWTFRAEPSVSLSFEDSIGPAEGRLGPTNLQGKIKQKCEIIYAGPWFLGLAGVINLYTFV